MVVTPNHSKPKQLFNDEPIGNKRFEALINEQLLHVDMIKCVMDSLDSRHTKSRVSSPIGSSMNNCFGLDSNG